MRKEVTDDVFPQVRLDVELKFFNNKLLRSKVKHWSSIWESPIHSLTYNLSLIRLISNQYFLKKRSYLIGVCLTIPITDYIHTSGYDILRNHIAPNNAQCRRTTLPIDLHDCSFLPLYLNLSVVHVFFSVYRQRVRVSNSWIHPLAWAGPTDPYHLATAKTRPCFLYYYAARRPGYSIFDSY